MARTSPQRTTITPLITWVVRLGLLLVLFLLWHWKVFSFSLKDWIDLVQRSGALGVWLYIGLWVVLPTFFFPVALLALVGGAVYGLASGSLYTFVGALLNCSVMFFLPRFFGAEWIRSRFFSKLSPLWQERLEKAEGRQGFILLILLRLIPLVPYNLINYGFGMTHMTFTTYLLGSALGIIPGTLVFINVGKQALDWKSPQFLLSILLLILLITVTTRAGKRLFPGGDSHTSTPEKETLLNEVDSTQTTEFTVLGAEYCQSDQPPEENS